MRFAVRISLRFKILRLFKIILCKDLLSYSRIYSFINEINQEPPDVLCIGNVFSRTRGFSNFKFIILINATCKIKTHISLSFSRPFRVSKCSNKHDAAVARILLYYFKQWKIYSSFFFSRRFEYQCRNQRDTNSSFVWVQQCSFYLRNIHTLESPLVMSWLIENWKSMKRSLVRFILRQGWRFLT